MNKHVEAGRIEDVDFRLTPLHVRQRRRNRHLAGDFFVVIVGDCGAVIHPAGPLRSAGCLQHGRNQRSLAGFAVSYYRDIPDVCAFVSLHGITPSSNRVGAATLGCPADQARPIYHAVDHYGGPIKMKKKRTSYRPSSSTMPKLRMLTQRKFTAQLVEGAIVSSDGRRNGSRASVNSYISHRRVARLGHAELRSRPRPIAQTVARRNGTRLLEWKDVHQPGRIPFPEDQGSRYSDSLSPQIRRGQLALLRAS